jgi:hypothetical protein
MSEVIKRINRKIHEEQSNFLCLIVGKVGKGKSMMACKLAQLLDPSFNLRRVVFNEDDLMDLIRSGLPRGSAIIADEIGSYFDSRRYMSETNRMLSHVIQTFRIYGLILFWTVPQGRQVDKDLRSMCDAIIEAKSINKKTRRVKASFKWLNSNPLTGKEYTKFPIKQRDVGPMQIHRINVSHPNDGAEGKPGFERRYVAKKLKSLDDLYKRDGERVKYMRDKELGKLKKTMGKIREAYCKPCDYGWETASQASKPTCPRCKGSSTTTTSSDNI